MWRNRHYLANLHLPKSMDGKKSPRRLAASSHTTNMEEEGQQKRLWNVQRHLPTKPHGQYVCQSPGTTNKVQSRTIPKRGTDRCQKRKGLHRRNFRLKTTERKSN